MTSNGYPIFAASDFAEVFADPIRPGRPALNDSEVIEVVRIGAANGQFRSAEQAAYYLSLQLHATDKNVGEAFRRRIAPKIAHLFRRVSS